MPTFSLGNWNEPVSLVVATCGWSSEGPVRVTVTPGQHGAGRVGDLAEDLAGLRLGPDRRRAEHERQRRQQGGQHAISSLYFLQESRNDGSERARDE